METLNLPALQPARPPPPPPLPEPSDASKQRFSFDSPHLTPKVLRSRSTYRTPELNEQLFLNHMSLRRLRPVGALAPFTALRALSLEGNALERIEGLEALGPTLRFLHLGDNQIHTLTGLRGLTGLQSLHLDRNMLSSLSTGNEDEEDGLRACAAKLEVLTLSGNDLGPATSSLGPLAPTADAVVSENNRAQGNFARSHVCFCQLRTLDLSSNLLDGAHAPQLLALLKGLGVHNDDEQGQRSGKQLTDAKAGGFAGAIGVSCAAAHAQRSKEELKVKSQTGDRSDSGGNGNDGDGSVEDRASATRCGLRTLSLAGNPLVSSTEMTHYRKRIIARMPSLAQLDGEIILQAERSRAEAFDAAYLEAVRKELGGAAGEEAAQAEYELRLRWSSVQGTHSVDTKYSCCTETVSDAPIVFVSRELRKSIEAAAQEAERAAARSVTAARRAEEDNACDAVLRMLEEAEKRLSPEEVAEEREIEARYLAAAEAEMLEDVNQKHGNSDSIVGRVSGGSKQSTCASARMPAQLSTPMAPMAALPPTPPSPATLLSDHTPQTIAARAAPTLSATTAIASGSCTATLTTTAVTTDFEALD